MIILGIDNGSSGSIGVLGYGEPRFFETPVIEQQDYTKAANRINRVDHVTLIDFFKELKATGEEVRAYIERPYVNPAQFKTTGRALRALEATLICLEQTQIGYQIIDSKGWQKELLPIGTEGSVNLKRASKEVGIKLFPEFAPIIKKHKDADGMLIAEWARRTLK